MHLYAHFFRNYSDFIVRDLFYWRINFDYNYERICRLLVDVVVDDEFVFFFVDVVFVFFVVLLLVNVRGYEWVFVRFLIVVEQHANVFVTI